MPYFKPHTVTIVGFDGALSSAITGAMDMFSFAGVSWERFNQLDPQPRFRVNIASMNKRPIECINRLSINAHVALQDVMQTDILLIPTIAGSINKVLTENKALLPHIVRISQSALDVASNCSGAFLLAKAGLLNGKSATTHWGYAELFEKMFPEVNLHAKQLITQSNNVYCAGGGAAFHHLCLLLIERYCGRELANQVAKAHVLDVYRSNQAYFTNLHSLKQHKQAHIIKVQEFIEDNYKSALSVTDLAALANTTSRTLNRQFQQWLNMRPIEYIQTIRIEQAKRLLEGEYKNIQTLAYEVGYEDPASFGKLFKKHTGYTPAQYREKFMRDFN